MEKKFISLVNNAKLLFSLSLLLISIDVFSIEEKDLPPSPGPENDKTLLGIDSNKNNVRDDVEIFIFKNLSQDSKLFHGYMKLAESFQLRLKYLNDEKKLKFYSDQFNSDSRCIDAIETVSGGKLIDKQAKLMRVLVKTQERRKVLDLIESKVGSGPVKNLYVEGKKLCR